MLSLVTGANGFLGSHLARFLVEQGEKVRVLVRPQSDRRALEGLSVEFVYADLRDADSLPPALSGVQRVYHVAADYRLWAKNPQEIYESNVTGSRNLLAAARQAGIDRFIYTSSVGTLVPRHPRALPDENTHLELKDMIGHYKRSKFLAEQEALKAARDGQPVVIVNPTTPVGPGDWKPTPTGRIILDFLNGKMPAYVDTGLNFVAVEDVAKGHWLAAERGEVGKRYILGDRNLTLKQMLEILAALSGRPMPRVRLPHAVPYLAALADSLASRLLGRPPRIPLEAVRLARHKMFVDSSLATRDLGFQPGPLEGALERAIHWYSDNGYLKRPLRGGAARVHAA
ncbi:MAG: hopanoid-associated sugar epimerase [Terriglobia bacterium]